MDAEVCYPVSGLWSLFPGLSFLVSGLLFPLLTPHSSLLTISSRVFGNFPSVAYIFPLSVL